MAKNNTYFFLSGFLSLTIFTLFIFLFFKMMFSDSNINTFALNKDNYISISLELVSTPTKNTNKKQKEVIVQKEIPKVIPEAKEIDIGNLFSEVWTKEVKIEKKKEKAIDTKRLERIQKPLNTSKDKQVESLEKNINNYEATLTDIEVKKSSSGDEVNEYLAKIQAIVYKYFNPPMNSEGHTVQALIELSAVGKVQDFRILSYSSNQALNKECDKIKTRLLGVLFPRNPNGSSSSTIVNITSDEN